MTNIVILNNELHRTLRVQPTGGDAKNIVPVIVGEFAHLVAYYPILFSKDSETGAFYCGAMLGFDPGENLFQGEGLLIYRPLNVQRGPFYTSNDELAIDLDSPRLGSGQPLFSETGEPSAYLQRIMAVFRNLVPGTEHTKVFITTLLRLNLIAPIDISASFDDGRKRNLEGLYTIDTETLQKLPDAQVVELFRRGYMEAIFLMIASVGRIPDLARKKNDMLLKGAEALTGALG